MKTLKRKEMTATSINKIIEKAKAELNSASAELKTKRVYPEIPYDKFTQLLTIECDKVLIARKMQPGFVIDKFNKRMVNILYSYLNGVEKNEVKPEKGILIGGSIGCGKTVLLKGFCNLITQVSNKIITNIHAMQLASIIREKGITMTMIKRPLFIDDLGKEEESVKSYGTDIRPLTELIAMRYDEGAWTFATTNYKMETLREKYTPHTADRMIEMFNYIILEGESRRK